MRRIAKNTRNDKVKSKRDYQTLHQISTQKIKFKEKSNRIVFRSVTPIENGFVGFGGFIYPEKACELNVTIYREDLDNINLQFELSENWNRVGFMWDENHESNEVIIELKFDDMKHVDIWGFNFETSKVRDVVQFEGTDEELLTTLNEAHLAPEAFYINHESVIENLQLNTDSMDDFSIDLDARDVLLKKCCYCQRFLPTNPQKNLSSFHKHSAKLSGFQNECRSCKKWRINKFFNPNRTKDQLHESSVITREKKILLREPMILREIKDRHNGDGLKSIVWKRFDKQCFNCGTKLKLSEVRLDHTRPLAYLWPLDEHATCLCENCNNSKHDDFPIDFYKDEQKLKQLSQIINLPYEELIKKDINEKELQRIIDEIDIFAITIDPKTFRSIRNKVKNVRPETDLYNLLYQKHPESHKYLMSKLEERIE